MNYIPPKRSAGTLETKRTKQPWPKDKPFRILSIDGGGICGILPAAVLAEFERRFLNGESISSSFDMIAGTSTGGIIALALGQKVPAREILDLYMDQGTAIFPPVGRLKKVAASVRSLLRYQYDPTALKEALQKKFNDMHFGASNTPLCIPAFEGVHGEPYIFKTPHHPDYKRDQHEKIVTVGLATSAAPTYFPPVENNGYQMVDGGIWANNPIMIAVIDALACFDITSEQIQILSLGCGATQFTLSEKHKTGGLYSWKDAIKASLRAQSLNALGQAYLLVGKPNVVRLDAPDNTNGIDLDDYKRAAAELPALGKSLADGSGRIVNEIFLSADTYEES